MKKCNCWIGILNSYDQSPENEIYLDIYIKHLNDIAEQSVKLNNYHPFNKIYIATDYIDKRKGLASLFSYCPKCGKKINWKNIRKDLRGEL